MNTCAECRFWKDVDVSAREFTFNPATWRDGGDWKECTRVDEDGAPMFMATSHSYDDALMTRSDFGCVQFEAKDGATVALRELFHTAAPGDKLTLAEPLKGIPIGDTTVTSSRGVKPGSYRLTPGGWRHESER